MHPQAVKTIFARLYSAWGDTDKKIVLAESLGYDYFKRKEAMSSDIRAAGFFEGERRVGFRVWKPNKEAAVIESKKLRAKRTLKTRSQERISKRKDKLIAILLRNRVSQQLAKLIKRGPIHQNEIDSASTARAVAQTQPLNDLFENLVADERTQDEIFLKPRTADIK